MNSRSLCRHFFDVQDFLATLDHSFFDLWLYWNVVQRSPPPPPPHHPPYVHMNNYQLVHSSRSLRSSRGAATFISNSLNFCLRSELMPSQDEFKAVFIWIQRDHASNLIVGNVCRAPGTPLNTFLWCCNSCLGGISKERKLYYIMGDFNLNLLNFVKITYPRISLWIHLFIWLPSSDHQTHLHYPAPSLIDNFLTNSSSSFGCSR